MPVMTEGAAHHDNFPDQGWQLRTPLQRERQVGESADRNDADFARIAPDQVNDGIGALPGFGAVGGFLQGNIA